MINENLDIYQQFEYYWYMKALFVSKNKAKMKRMVNRDLWGNSGKLLQESVIAFY